MHNWTKSSDFVHSNDKTEQNESLPPREMVDQALSADEEKVKRCLFAKILVNIKFIRKNFSE